MSESLLMYGLLQDTETDSLDHNFMHAAWGATQCAVSVSTTLHQATGNLDVIYVCAFILVALLQAHWQPRCSCLCSRPACMLRLGMHHAVFIDLGSVLLHVRLACA